MVAALFTLGVFLRFQNLATRHFWHDELLTSLRAAGAEEADLAKLARSSLHTPVSVSDVHELLRPSGEISLVGFIERSHTQGYFPVYYLLLRGWMQIWGSEVIDVRALSAVLSVCGLCFAYLLGRRLSGNVLGGLACLSVLAVSPLQVLFAQENRFYALLILSTLASHFCLHRFLTEGQKRRDLIAYLFSIVVGLFTHLLFVFNVAAHVVIIFIFYLYNHNQFSSRTFWSFFSTFLIAGLLPAAWVLKKVFEVNLKFHHSSSFKPWTTLLSEGTGNLMQSLFALPADVVLPVWLSIALILILIVMLVLFARTKRLSLATRLFILIPFVLPALVLIGGDLVFATSRVTIPRYLTLLGTGLSLFVGVGLSTLLVRNSRWYRALAAAIMLGLLSIGAYSSLIATRDTTYNKIGYGLEEYDQVRELVLEYPDYPLILSLHDTDSFLVALKLESDRRLMIFDPWERGSGLMRTFRKVPGAALYLSRRQRVPHGELNAGRFRPEAELRYFALWRRSEGTTPRSPVKRYDR